LSSIISLGGRAKDLRNDVAVTCEDVEDEEGDGGPECVMLLLLGGTESLTGLLGVAHDNSSLLVGFVADGESSAVLVVLLVDAGYSVVTVCNVGGVRESVGVGICSWTKLGFVKTPVSTGTRRVR
jgi:hypothetical protein